jgi:hypothetical protein
MNYRLRIYDTNSGRQTHLAIEEHPVWSQTPLRHPRCTFVMSSKTCPKTPTLLPLLNNSKTGWLGIFRMNPRLAKAG